MNRCSLSLFSGNRLILQLRFLRGLMRKPLQWQYMLNFNRCVHLFCKNPRVPSPKKLVSTLWTGYNNRSWFQTKDDVIMELGKIWFVKYNSRNWNLAMKYKHFLVLKSPQYHSQVEFDSSVKTVEYVLWWCDTITTQLTSEQTLPYFNLMDSSHQWDVEEDYHLKIVVNNSLPKSQQWEWPRTLSREIPGLNS